MFKPKRVLAFALTLAMAFGSMTATLAYNPPSDVMGTQYEEAARVMGALNIMIGDDQGLFRPEDPIRRSEFAKLAVSLLGLQDIAESAKGATKYGDVQLDHWATGYINVATNQNIMIGDENGNFRPDDNILYRDAVTALVRVLGYEPSANAKGGYPTGFLVVGSQTGLIQSNSTSGNDTPSSRGLLANLSFNSLTINLMEQTGFGENPTYSVTEKTLLEDKLKTTKVEGQVTANNLTRLNGSASGLKDDEVEVAGAIYKTNGSNAADFIGKNVIVYAKENKAHNSKDIVLIQEDSVKNSSLSIQAENLDTMNDVSGYKQLEYWLNKDADYATQKARIKTDATMFFNQKVVSFDKNLMFPANGLEGSVELIDNDQDGIYDIVKVVSFENFVVDEVSTSSYRINDKYDAGSIVLDPNDNSLKFSITKNGSKVELKDLKEWDVLSVAKSKDEKFFDIRVSDQSVQGKVTEKRNDKVGIDGTMYPVANNYTNDINLQDEGTFYLDVNGKIAAVDTTATMSDNYAYLVDAGTTSGIDTTAQFKFFKKDGSIVVLTGAEKVKVNGTSMKGSEAIDALKANASDQNVKAQLVTIDTNAEGKLTAVRTAADKTGEASMVYGQKTFTKNFAKDGVAYRATSGKLDRIVVNENTIVFDIPAGVTDETEYAIRNKSMFENETNYNVQAFDVGEDLSARVLIVTNSTGATSEESPIAVVESISEVQNAEGTMVQRLYAIQNGEKISKDTNVDKVLVKGQKTLEPGDIIQYRTNAKGEIDKITVLFDKANVGTESSTAVSDNMTLVVGKVMKKFTSSINVSVNDGDVNNYSIANAQVYNYDSKKVGGQVTIASAGDIQKFDDGDPRYVFLRIYKDEVKEVVILR